MVWAKEYLDVVTYDTLNMNLGDTIHLLDLYENGSFSDENFIDTDYLLDSGTEKLTKIVSEILTDVQNI